MKNKKDFFVPGNDPGYMVHYLDTQLKVGLQRAFHAKGFSFTAVYIPLKTATNSGTNRPPIPLHCGRLIGA